MKYEHVTVLKQQMIEVLRLKAGDIAIDCTAGGGGHTRELLSVVGKAGKVLAIDQDENSIEHLSQIFAEEIAEGNLILVHQKFSQIKEVAVQHQLSGQVHGICADLGISSEHVDNPERGFSFMNDGPLAMNMSRRYTTASAADIVNSYPLEELVRIFKSYGEERGAYSIAQAIVKRRSSAPFSRTSQLAELVENMTPFRYRTKKHPATKIFQALRIEVNGELDELKTLLEDGFSLLSPKGRMAIISFHSLEDRLVKHYFRKISGLEGNVIPRDIPLAAHEEEERKLAAIIKPFPMIPSDAEIDHNVRARSAKLRVIEKK